MTAGVPPRAFSLPEIHSSQGKNGWKGFAVSWPELPLVSLHLILPFGAEADPPGRGGLADLSAEMLTRGTRNRSALQLAAEIDGMGAVLSSHSGWNGSSLSLTGLSEGQAQVACASTGLTGATATAAGSGSRVNHRPARTRKNAAAIAAAIRASFRLAAAASAGSAFASSA